MELAVRNPTFNDAMTACYMNSSAYLNTANFNPLYQQFVLLTADKSFMLINTSDVIQFDTSKTISAAIFGAQFGAVLAVLVMALLLTKTEKRKTLPFIFNIAALLCDFIRCILQLVQLTSIPSTFPVQALSIQNPPGATLMMALSVADTLFTFLLFVSIELALITQVYILCTAAASRMQRRLVTVLTVFVGSVAVAFRLYLAALNILSTTRPREITEASQRQLSTAQSMSNIASIISIALFNIVFCSKLSLAIKNRRRLGVTGFGNMEIIMVGGSVTLVASTIFAILDYFVFPKAQLGSVVDTLVAVCLPVTSIWAACHVRGEFSGHQGGAITARPGIAQGIELERLSTSPVPSMS